MILYEFLSLLNGPKRRGQRWTAKCPAHADKSPSLSVSEGERGLRFDAGPAVSVDEICKALGLSQSDLFFDPLDTNPQRRKAAAQERARQHRRQQDEARKLGRRIDACREAEWFIRSRQGCTITDWTDERLAQELDLLADAYHLLSMEES